MRLAYLAVAALAMSACTGHVPPPTNGGGTGTPGTDTPETPFVCPAGMPSWKCDQLRKQNDPNYQPPPPPLNT